MVKMAKKIEGGPPTCHHHHMAIQEINRAHELMSQLHAVLLQLFPEQVGGDILKEILTLTSSALSGLQSIRCESSGGSDDDRRCASDKRKSLQRSDRPGDHKRRRKPETWSIVTSVPYGDGYQWRKYGQKMINNAKYPRSYYRCTYREGQGCLAKKTVQQEDSCADPPSFKVEYSIQHTCKTIDTVVPFVMDSTPKEALIHTGGFSSEQHLSLSSDTGGNLIQDESLWIYDQMQECPPLVPELLGKMDMASSILSPTGPWDWDMLMGDDDGW
ncbi:probable WRKY transcription factor 70 [Musa acuminata AAA Group]|uniref:probable WRKY transcription factor 70 n=1 Tax=Musa acuminata AAA Group TaxID=214697 RepID=UPI0031E39093